MLGVEAFDNLDMLLGSGSFAGSFGLEESCSWLTALGVSTPVPKFSAVPTLRLFLFNLLVPIQLQLGVQ